MLAADPEACKVRYWARTAGLDLPANQAVPEYAIRAYHDAGAPWPPPLTDERYWEGDEMARAEQPWLGGIPLVYMIFSADGQLIYIGSTADLPERLLKRRKTHKFRRWMAWPMPSRLDAYVAEDQWIRTYRPVVNIVKRCGANVPRAADQAKVWPVPEDVVPVRLMAEEPCCATHPLVRQHLVSDVEPFSPHDYPYCRLARSTSRGT